jgi:LAO/AO transport system kinase
LELVEKMLAGDRLSLSRLMTKVESRSPEVAGIMAEIHPRTGKAYKIGVTGPPGAGKSTLTDQLIQAVRARDMTVGVVAVDPSSPFSGGAVLGDRIRMMRHSGDTDVFIRSLGTRGSHGGLSRATKEIAQLYDAFGKDVVIIETVGVGQTELDIMDLADTTIVVLVPESGDTIQTMKAGITEIADVFVINKSDRDGAETIRREIETMVEIGQGADPAWRIPVLMTVASTGQGIGELVETILRHREFRRKTGKDAEALWRSQLHDIRDLIVERFEACLLKESGGGMMDGFREDLLAGRTSPYAVAMKILEDPDLARRVLLCKLNGGK